jgi:hypothetical protein
MPPRVRSALLAALLMLGAATHRGAAEAPAAEAPALHFLAGLAAGALATAAALPAVSRLEPGQAAAVVASAAAGSSLLIGAIKEIADLRGFGDPSWVDLGITLLGGATAGFLGAAASALAADQPQARSALSGVCLCFGFVLSLPVAGELARRQAPGASRPTPSSGPRS